MNEQERVARAIDPKAWLGEGGIYAARQSKALSNADAAISAYKASLEEQGLVVVPREAPYVDQSIGEEPVMGEECPKCSMPTLVQQEGCAVCKSCGFSSCS